MPTDTRLPGAPAQRSVPPAAWAPAILIASLVLVALNLRPALSSLSPLLRQVSASLGITASTAGLLTTLPVLCLGLFAPLAPILARRFGAERTVGAVLLMLALGIVLRTQLGTFGMFAGSVLAGASIGVIGVLLPGIVKRDFPRHAGTMMGVYSMALCLGAAVAAGASVPLSQMFDNSWRIGLGFWLIPAVIAAALWWPQARASHHLGRARYKVHGLFRDPLAWQVTLFMGLQSSLAYIVFGWLPSILIDRGLSPAEAGLVTSGSIIMQLFSSLSAPWLATRGRDQRLVILWVMALSLVGLFGCLYAPLGGLWGWAVVLGLGQGGTFAVALTLIVLRAGNAQVAASLSGMAQGFGYTLASMGPLAVGVVHDLTNGWAAMGWVFAVIGLGATLAGMGAGRARLVNARTEQLNG